MSKLIIWVILWHFLQIIPEQHLISWEPLHWFQHVVLQGQAATNLPTLKLGTINIHRKRILACNHRSESHLYILDDVSESRRAFGPGSHQLHGLIKVPDIVCIHPQEGRMLQQNITKTRPLTPRFDTSREVNSTVVQIFSWNAFWHVLNSYCPIEKEKDMFSNLTIGSVKAALQTFK